MADRPWNKGPQVAKGFMVFTGSLFLLVMVLFGLSWLLS